MKDGHGGERLRCVFLYLYIWRLFKRHIERSGSFVGTAPTFVVQSAGVGGSYFFLCGFGPVVLAKCHLHRVVQCFAHHGDGGVGGGLSAYGGKDFAGGLCRVALRCVAPRWWRGRRDEARHDGDGESCFDEVGVRDHVVGAVADDRLESCGAALVECPAAGGVLLHFQDPGQCVCLLD